MHKLKNIQPGNIAAILKQGLITLLSNAFKIKRFLLEWADKVI